MKKIALVLGTFMLFAMTSVTLTSCGNDATHEEHAHAQYQCPMNCEKGKTYDEPGKCPVCKMDLKEVK